MRLNERLTKREKLFNKISKENRLKKAETPKKIKKAITSFPNKTLYNSAKENQKNEYKTDYQKISQTNIYNHNNDIQLTMTTKAPINLDSYGLDNDVLL